jgi:hypothetical protein
MSAEKLPRPRQVTMAGWMVMAGSALVVLTVFDRVGSLRDLETREAVDEFLSQPPGNGLGLDVPGALQLLEVVSMVAAGCAAAAMILGFHVLRRSRSARLALTLIAVPLFLSGLVVGGFLSSLVAAAVFMLWLEPARAWFDGRAPRQPETVGDRGPWGTPPEQRSAPPSAPPSTPPSPPTSAPAPTGSAPRPHEGFGRPPGPAEAPAERQPFPPYAPPAPWGSPPPTRRRPAAVLWACVLTWVFTGLATLVMGLSALVLATAPDLVFEELARQDPTFDRQGITDQAIRVATWITAGVTIVWSVAAAVLAFFVFRGTGWARVALAGSSVGAGVVCLLAAIGSLLTVLPLTACAVTVALLLRPEVRAWCART